MKPNDLSAQVFQIHAPRVILFLSNYLAVDESGDV